MQTALTRLQQDLKRRNPPPLTHDRRKCTLCSWRRSCDGVAEAQGELSTVSGIGGKRQELLQELGIADRQALADAPTDWLMQQLDERGIQQPELAIELIAQAKVQQCGIAEPLQYGNPDPLPELSDAPGVLLYDIESDPDARDDFLHGFLPLSRGADGRFEAAGSAPYRPILALREPRGEDRLWLRLQRLLAAHPGWPVLHYGETEAIALKRMAERQKRAAPRLGGFAPAFGSTGGYPSTATGSKQWPAGEASAGASPPPKGPAVCSGGANGEHAASAINSIRSFATTATTASRPGRWLSGYRTQRHPAATTPAQRARLSPAAAMQQQQAAVPLQRCDHRGALTCGGAQLLAKLRCDRSGRHHKTPELLLETIA